MSPRKATGTTKPKRVKMIQDPNVYQSSFDLFPREPAAPPPPSIHVCEFDSKREYRWWLEANLYEDEPPAGDKGICMFLMLNPSVADEQQSDRTVTRCKKYAEGWGYYTLNVCNIFALRSQDRDVLKGHEDPIGSLNDYWIKKTAEQANMIICAWGTYGELRDRGPRVLHMLEEEGHSDKMFHLGSLTVNGHPTHPLYKAADIELVKYEPKLVGAW